MKILYPLKGIGTVQGVYQTQGFGEHPEIYKRFGLKGHNGLDWAAPKNHPVIACHDGKVTPKPLDPKGYGLHLVLEWEEEGYTYEAVYAHLYRIQSGLNRVKTGDIIGYVDSTGFSTGDHLHFGVRKRKGEIVENYNNGYFGYFDPTPFLTKFMSKTRVVKSKQSETIYLCYPIPSWQHLEERASLEGFEIPDKIPDTDSLD